MIHRLSQEILNFSMYMLGCKAALEQDLSIGAIFRRKTYWDVPLILSTRLNGMYLSLLVLLVRANILLLSSNNISLKAAVFVLLVISVPR